MMKLKPTKSTAPSWNPETPEELHKLLKNRAAFWAKKAQSGSNGGGIFSKEYCDGRAGGFSAASHYLSHMIQAMQPLPTDDSEAFK